MSDCPFCSSALPTGADRCPRCGRRTGGPDGGLAGVADLLGTPPPSVSVSATLPAPSTVTVPASATAGAAPTTLADPLPRPPRVPVKLVVVRGERLDAEYPLLDGKNFVGRSADQPVDVDLEGQEPADRVWASRVHAVVTVDRGGLTVEDLYSLNGTFVNRQRVHPGQAVPLRPGDVVQVGTVQLRVVVG
ncbi:MAG: FHA domain-containing protein [Gemmataceae bacterium]